MTGVASCLYQRIYFSVILLIISSDKIPQSRYTSGFSEQQSHSKSFLGSKNSAITDIYFTKGTLKIYPSILPLELIAVSI